MWRPSCGGGHGVMNYRYMLCAQSRSERGRKDALSELLIQLGSLGETEAHLSLKYLQRWSSL